MRKQNVTNILLNLVGNSKLGTFFKLETTNTRKIQSVTPFADIDKKWDPNPVDPFPHERLDYDDKRSAEFENFLTCVALETAKHFDIDINPDEYIKLVVNKTHTEDVAMMGFSAVDWHQDNVSDYPLRVLIPFNNSNLRLYYSNCFNVFKPPKFKDVTLSCEFKSELYVDLKVNRVITFFEDALHMAAPALNEGPNASICLTLPHPLYSSLSKEDVKKVNTYIKSFLKEVNSNSFLNESLTFVPHKWWSSIHNTHTLNDIRKNRFEPVARDKGYDLGRYNGLTNEPYIEPTTANAWEAFLMGVDFMYSKCEGERVYE
jgi:hypothetical protein